MSARTIYVDDLDGTEVDETTAARGVVVTVKLGDTVTEGKPLDLTPVNYEALVRLANGDADGVREVFAPNTGTRRSKTEIDHIRTVANEALTPEGERRFDVKATGRLPRNVIEWFENEYSVTQANAQTDAQDNSTADEGNDASADASATVPAPRRGNRK